MSNLTLKLIRFAFVFLFLWFGVNQLLHPSAYVGFLPDWLGYTPIPFSTFVKLNGWAEVVMSILLLTGIFTRQVFALLGLHLLVIAVSVGGDIGIRDFVLAVVILALVLNEPDDFTLDRKWNSSTSKYLKS